MIPPADSPLNPTLAPREPCSAERALDETLVLVEVCGELLEQRLAALSELAPRLRFVRALRAGAWIFGLQGERERDGAAFGRLMLHLSVHAKSAQLECVARSGVGARDRRTKELSVPLDDSALQHLATFTEDVVLDFAAAYFASDRDAFRSITAC